MRVLRGYASRPKADREWTASMLASAERGTPGVRVWTPPKQVAFGRRDAREPGFERAKRLAATRGFQPVQRDVGGRAVAYTGQTLAFAHAVPLGDERRSIADRYGLATEVIVASLRDLGAEVAAGEPSAAFCPGDHSVRVAGGGKLSGIAQRVRADAAIIAGCLLVAADDARLVAEITDPVYDALGVPFDQRTVGSVAAAGGPSDPERVARVIEEAFIDGPWSDRSDHIERVSEREPNP